jgi:hypothetical protein
MIRATKVYALLLPTGGVQASLAAISPSLVVAD